MVSNHEFLTAPRLCASARFFVINLAITWNWKGIAKSPSSTSAVARLAMYKLVGWQCKLLFWRKHMFFHTPFSENYLFNLIAFWYLNCSAYSYFQKYTYFMKNFVLIFLYLKCSANSCFEKNTYFVFISFHISTFI